GLAERTEHLHEHGTDSPRLAELDPANACFERLAQLVLAIRQRARLHLGVRRHREREWLEEYYFLLACYGAVAGRFPTYGQRELVGLLQEAGAQEVAARARKGAEEAAPGYDGEAVWLLATRAEAHFLLGEQPQAERLYR